MRRKTVQFVVFNGKGTNVRKIIDKLGNLKVLIVILTLEL